MSFDRKYLESLRLFKEADEDTIRKKQQDKIRANYPATAKAEADRRAKAGLEDVETVIGQNMPEDDNDVDISDLAGDKEVSDLDLPSRMQVNVPGTQDKDSTGRLVTQKQSLNISAYSHKRIQYFVHQAYHSRNSKDGGSLLIFGDPGLGKSQVVDYTVSQIAKNMNREYVDFNSLGSGNIDANDIVNNPEKYFLYVDLRASSLQPFDLTGIPDIGDRDNPYSTSKPPTWAYLLGLEGIHGVLFLDELGHAAPDVSNALFQVVLDKKAGPVKFSEGVFVVAASNLAGEFDPASGSSALPQPLINRFNVVGLVANPEDWYEYAQDAGISDITIAFVKHNPDEHFYLKPDAEESPNDPFPTPRSIVSFDRQFKRARQEYARDKRQAESRGVSFAPERDIYEIMYDLASATCGGDWADKYLNFVSQYAKIDLQAHANDPDTLKGRSADYLIGLQTKIAKHVEDFYLDDVSEEELMSQDFKHRAEYEVAASILGNIPKEHIPAAVSSLNSRNKKAAQAFYAWIYKGHFMNPQLAIHWRGYSNYEDNPIVDDPDSPNYGQREAKLGEKSLLAAVQRSAKQQAEY